MRVTHVVAALAVALLVAGCWGAPGKKPEPARAPGGTAPVEAQPADKPERAVPHVLGVTLEPLGPGLVVEGLTSLPRVHVELQAAGAVLQAADVTPKDDGRWRLAWPAPALPGAEVVVTAPGDAAAVLVRGVVGTRLHEGLFYSTRMAGVHVDVPAAKGGTVLTVAGTSLGLQAFKVEMRYGEQVLAFHELTAQAGGVFSARLPRPELATQVWFYSEAGLELVVPIVTH